MMQSFSSNIPACMGHVQAANHYLVSLILRNVDSRIEETSMKGDLRPLEACLRSLGLTCRVAVSFPRVMAMPSRSCPPRGPALTAQDTPRVMVDVLQSLVDLVSQDGDIEQLIWSPLMAASRRIPAAVIEGYEEKLREWRELHIYTLPEIDSDLALENMLRHNWDKYTMPPAAYSSAPPHTCLTAAHFNFYMGRIRWALCLLGQDAERNEQAAYFYFYEAMRFAATHASGPIQVKDVNDSYVPHEALKYGFLPLLHITGLCSPRPSWSRWIRELCNHIEHEGVFKGDTLGINLDCLHTFEMYSNEQAPAVLEKFPKAADRVICQMIPGIDGRNFVSYFARPKPGSDPQRDGLTAYQVLGHAKWRCYFGEFPCCPEIELYDQKRTSMESFSLDWLANTQSGLDWLTWSTNAEFNMDRAIQDHISGTRLLPAPDELQAPL